MPPPYDHQHAACARCITANCLAIEGAGPKSSRALLRRIHLSRLSSTSTWSGVSCARPCCLVELVSWSLGDTLETNNKERPRCARRAKSLDSPSIVVITQLMATGLTASTSELNLFGTERRCCLLPARNGPITIEPSSSERNRATRSLASPHRALTAKDSSVCNLLSRKTTDR